MRRKPIDIKRIIEAYNNGENESEIAKKFGISEVDVLAIILRKGIEERKQRERISRLNQKEIAYEEIAQIEAIANAEVLTILGEERSKKYAAIQKNNRNNQNFILDDSENGSAIGFNDVKLNIQSKIAKGESHLIAQYIEDLLNQQSENFTDRQIERLKQFKSNKTDKTLKNFIDARSIQVQLFIDNINTVNKLYNEPLEFLIYKEYIYIKN